MSECLVYGVHAIEACLRHPKRTCLALWIKTERCCARVEALLALATEKQVPIHRVSAAILMETFGQVIPQGMVLVAQTLPVYTEQDLTTLTQSAPLSRILILDGVTDPHNLGACLRVADGTGVTCVIVPKNQSATPHHPIVSKVASGALESVPCIQVTNLVRTLKWLKQLGMWIYGAAGEATQTLWEMDFKGSSVIIMGAEGKGLRRLTREHCDALFSIPMHGQVESLNVSVATGVCLYEVLRQQDFLSVASYRNK